MILTTDGFNNIKKNKPGAVQKLEFSKGWFVGGEAQLLKGAHDKDVSAAVQFKRVW